MPSFKTTIFADADAVADAVAAQVASTVKSHPQLTLGLATGKTFRQIYDRLVERFREGAFSLSAARSFNLDEYVGLPPKHPASFTAYMDDVLFRHVDLPAGAARLPSVAGGGSLAECAAYEAAIEAAGGIDLQLLGIGRNGHIGFNEPGSSFDSRTRLVALTDSTRQANAADFPEGESTPPSAVTMGIGTILEARQIVLVATGAHKHAPLQAVLSGIPDADCPASALHNHRNLHIFADEAAWSGIKI